MPNRYTGVENDPFQESQHIYTGPAWAKFFRALGDGPVRMSAPGGQIGASPSLGAMSPGYRIGDEDVQRSLAINSYLGDLQDERRVRDQSLRAMSNQNDQADAAARDRQTVERAAAIANTPGVSQYGRPIVGKDGSYRTAQAEGGPVDRQQIAAQMAPGLIQESPPPKPVTYGNPEAAMVNGQRVFVRPGSDGQMYGMDRRPIAAETLQPPPDKNAPLTSFVPPTDAQGAPIMGDALLKTFPQAKQTMLTRIIEGRQALPTGSALKDPYWKDLIETAGLVDPSFDTVNYNERNKAFTDLSSPSGTGGKSINALNTAAQHISRLSDLVEKLDNFDTPMLNRVRNPVEREFGSTKVTNFDAVQPQAMKEIERLWRGAGGSTGEIDKLKESLGPNMGKQQQREALAEFADLMLGKLDATRSQRDSALGPIASQRVPVLFDQNKAKLSQIFQRAGRTAPDILSGSSAAGGGMIRAMDPQGNVHEAKAGTALPPGWKLQ